jgi:hypothetical protein
MQRIPVDMAQCRAMVSEVPKPRMRDGQQRTDRTGAPEWLVGVCMMQQRGSDVIAVIVVGEPTGLGVGRPALVSGLVAMPWERDGRHGITYRADSITAPDQPPAGPAPTGPQRSSRGAA